MSSLFEVSPVFERLPAQFNTHQFAQAYLDLYPGHFTGLLKSVGAKKPNVALRGVHALMGNYLKRYCARSLRPLAYKQLAYPFLAVPTSDAFSMWQRR